MVDREGPEPQRRRKVNPYELPQLPLHQVFIASPTDIKIIPVTRPIVTPQQLHLSHYKRANYRSSPRSCHIEVQLYGNLVDSVYIYQMGNLRAIHWDSSLSEEVMGVEVHLDIWFHFFCYFV